MEAGWGQGIQEDVARYFRGEPLADVAAMYDRLFREHVDRVTPIEGALPLVSTLAERGLLLAVVTNTPRDIAERTSRAGIRAAPARPGRRRRGGAGEARSRTSPSGGDASRDRPPAGGLRRRHPGRRRGGTAGALPDRGLSDCGGGCADRGAPRAHPAPRRRAIAVPASGTACSHVGAHPMERDHRRRDAGRRVAAARSALVRTGIASVRGVCGRRLSRRGLSCTYSPSLRSRVPPLA